MRRSQELEADGAAGGVRKGGFGKADAPQGTDQHIGHRAEPQPKCWRAGRRGSAVDIEVELTLLDAVRCRPTLVGRQFYSLCECGPVDEWSQRGWRWASSLVLSLVRAAPRLDRTICQSAGQRQPEWACQPTQRCQPECLRAFDIDVSNPLGDAALGRLQPND